MRIVKALLMGLAAVGSFGLAAYVFVAFLGHDPPMCAGGHTRVFGCTTMGAAFATCLLGLGATALGVAIAALRRD